MNYKVWTEEELRDPKNWDFQFGTDWNAPDLHDVWIHEAGREYGIETIPFCETKKFTRYPTKGETDPHPTDGVLESAPFYSVYQENSILETALDPSRATFQFPGASTFLHFIEIDHQQTETDIRKAFDLWLKRIREELGFRKNKGGRPSYSCEPKRLLEDLAVYRFRSAGYNSASAAAIGFEQKLREVKTNRTTGFKKAAEQTKTRLDGLQEYFGEIWHEEQLIRDYKIPRTNPT